MAFLIVIAFGAFSENLPKDPLKDETEYKIVASDQLNEQMQTCTGHNLDIIKDYVAIHDIKHGIISEVAGKYYVWVATNKGDEHVFRIDRYIQGNKRSPPSIKRQLS